MFQWNQTYIVNDATKIQTVEGRVRILGATDLVKEGIVEVRKSPYVAPVNGFVAITLPTSEQMTNDLGRIKLYVRLSGNNNPYFANDMVFKGKPFIYEFKKGATAGDVAKTINAINAAYGDKYLKVYVATSEQFEGKYTGKLIFEGDNYMMFTEAVVEEFFPIDSHINGGVWKENDKATVVKTNPENGFGTYEQILKDLRLPTAENTQWASINAQEMPIPGAEYTQYTVTYKNEVGVQGAGHVGDLVTAQTTHAFYVVSTATSAFESAVGKFFNLEIDEDNTESDWKAPTEG